MTEADVDRRIARALRMLADLAKEMGRGDADGIRRVADALDPPEVELKPCPFCGEPAKLDPRDDTVCCANKQCDFCSWLSREQWNRREVPHGH